jgi:cardiolipin synthase
LPRWAIVIVIARELFMLLLSRYAIRRGVELKINWPGRLGVAPTLGAPFFAMAGVHWLALVTLYAGMALGLLATVLYIRRGLEDLRARQSLAAEPERKPSSRPSSSD